MGRTLLTAAALAGLVLSQPAPALAASCEDICAEKAVENCEDLDSFECGAYILGCLAGCSTAKLFKWIVK